MHHNPAPVGVWSADVLSLIERDEFGAILRAHAGNIRHLFFGHTHYSLSGALEGIPFSAPRSTNHPCWPEISNGHRAGFGPIAPNYNIALFTGSAVVVHTVDFMLEDEISWFEVPDEHSWRHGATPEP
jgi:hypothetical protein